MNLESLWQIVLFGIALSADAFSVAIALSLNVSDLNKRRMVFIAATFGFCQGLFPLAGYWLVELVSFLAGSAAGERAGSILSTIVAYLSFALLLFVGGKMLFEAISELKKKEEDREEKLFSIKEVLSLGAITAIDALATGVAFHNVDAAGVSTSNNVTIWLHVAIIAVITFGISLLGVLFGSFFERLLRGKVSVSGIIGGSILILLGIYVLVSHYLVF